MKFEELTLTPDPPVSGQTAQLLALNGVAPAAVTGGGGVMYAELDGVPVFTSPPLLTCGPSVRRRRGRARARGGREEGRGPRSAAAGARGCERRRAARLTRRASPPPLPRAAVY